MSEIAKHWIDGEWVGSETVSESVNPATGAVLGRWADGGEAEARAAIAATSAACAALSRSRSSPKPRPSSTPFRRSRAEPARLSSTALT
jgi:acyl-CoA reductase-like NAD-dependent aldehyde dehydrogenase